MNSESKIADDTSNYTREATTSQDNSSLLSCTNEASILHTDQNKIKGCISRSQIQTINDTSIEKSDNGSNEVSSKQQKLNESECNTSAGNLNDNRVTFQRNTLIAEQQNYHFINESAQNESSNANLGAGSETANNYQSNPYGHEDNWNEWRVTNEDELEEREEDEDENNKEVVDYLKIKKLFPNWHIVPEVMNRQIGNNPLFERRFYGSLYAVEQLQLMYKLNEHVPDYCEIEALNFNHKGNLLLCAVWKRISIWDWTVGKRNCCYTSNSTRVLYAMWLPLEHLIAISEYDGQVCLLDIESNSSKKLAQHRGASYKLAVHPDIPHVIFSAGTDSKVLSIDIRESEPKELFEIKESSLNDVLYSIRFNPSNSNEFCIAGQFYCVMIYDRRQVSRPLYKLWPNCVDRDRSVSVMSAIYNHNGTEILASYNDKILVLFNRLTSSHGDYGHVYYDYYTNRSHYRSQLSECIFFGPKSEYVISGSTDDIFIWEKNSESIIQCMSGDREYVNCLDCHPHIPILVTSGCDAVKLWAPSKEEHSVMRSSGDRFITDPNGRMPLRSGLENKNRDEDDDDSNSSNL